LKELTAILNTYEGAKKANHPVVLATVVHVEGSSYRRAGARMLVDEMGTMTGAISGGCLEGDALRKALHALHQNSNKLVTYDTSDEEDAIIGAQLGCNGVIQVLFEPIDFAQPDNPLEIIKQAKAYGLSVIGTFFNLDRTKEQVGTTCWMRASSKIEGKVHASIKKQLIKDGSIAFATQVSLFREYVYGNDSMYAFIEVLKKPIKLVLVGAGNDAQITAQMAELLGWEITIVDGRSSHARPDRFVSSCQVLVSKPEEVLDPIVVDDQAAFILMTHNYNYDLAVLKVLLEQEKLPYIGILGPRKKYDRMLEEMKDEGIELTEEQREKIYAPVGLELGAETPEEIALSILSEVQAVKSETKGSFLKEKEGPIHRNKNNDFKQITIE